KTYFRSSSTSAKIDRNSGERWKKTGRASSSSVSSGTGVGPGVRRRNFIIRVRSLFDGRNWFDAGIVKNGRTRGLRRLSSISQRRTHERRPVMRANKILSQSCRNHSKFREVNDGQTQAPLRQATGGLAGVGRRY